MSVISERVYKCVLVLESGLCLSNMQWSTAYHIHRPIHTITNKKSSRRFTNESLCTCSFSRSFVQWIALKKANATQFHTIILSTKMKKKYKVPLSKALCVHKRNTLAWNSVSVWKSTIFTTTLKLAREIYKYISYKYSSIIRSIVHTYTRSMIHLHSYTQISSNINSSWIIKRRPIPNECSKHTKRLRK